MTIGYLEEISSQRFIANLISLESELKIVHCASNELQNSKLLLPFAIRLINITKKNLFNMHSNEVWEKPDKKIVIKTKENFIGVDLKENHKWKQVLNKNLQDYFVSLTVVKNISKSPILENLYLF